MTPATAPVGPRLPLSGGRRAIWAPAASLLLHGAALAGILLLMHRSPPPQPAEEPAVAMVWEPSQAEDSIANPDAGEPLPPVPAPPEQPAVPPAPPEAAPPPPPPPMAAPAAPPMPAPPVLAELPPVAPMEPLPPALVPTPDALPPPPPREAAEPPPAPPHAVETAAEPAEPPPEELPLPPPPIPPPPRPAPPRQTTARVAPPAAPQAAASQAPEPAVRGGSAQITGVTANASPLYRPPEPRYPDGARRRNETGTVRVRVQLDAAGRVTQVELVSSSGSAELDRLAQNYFAQWRWRPAMHNGQPVAGNVVTGITFRLSP